MGVEGANRRAAAASAGGPRGTNVPPTRRRGAELDAAILAAARAELAERGYADLTIEGVARRAGTAKTVLYRRHPSKAHLVLHAAIADVSAETAYPDTGSLRGDLLELVLALNLRVRAVGIDTFRGLLADTSQEEMRELAGFTAAFAAEWLDDIYAAARARGEMGEEPVSERVATLPITLLRHAMVFEGGLERAALEEIVDEICLPLLTRGGDEARG